VPFELVTTNILMKFMGCR